jgi:hypothetical protein
MSAKPTRYWPTSGRPRRSEDIRLMPDIVNGFFMRLLVEGDTFSTGF